LTVNSGAIAEVTEPFAERFRRLREAGGLTLSAVAAPRYTVSYASQIESGKRMPSDEALAHFASKLGVSAAYLTTGVPDDLEDRLRYVLEDARAALRQGDSSRALELARQVREEAEQYQLIPIRAEALALAGDALLWLSRTREAIDRFEEALEEGLNDRERGIAVAKLAAAYRTVGDLSYAAELIESTLKAFRDAPLDPAINAELHSVLVSIYFERGDVTKAERVAQQALRAATEGISPLTRANVLWSASFVLAEAKRWDEALELAKEARVLLEGLDDKLRLARVYAAYAHLCLEDDPPRLTEAAQHLSESEQLLGTDGPPHELAYVYHERARIALLSGDPREALADSERAFEKVGDDPIERARCTYLHGRAQGELGRLDQALNDFMEAAAAFEKVGARQQVASCYREIGEIEFRDGKLESAVEAFRTGLEALEPRRSRA
jgi:tetratricopeptide (TPR) repeat protein